MRSRRSVPTTSGACSGRPTSSTPAPDTRAGELDDDGLREVEDAAIRDVVALQRDAGVRTATDGEFRRTSWHMDFIYQLEGVDPTDQKLAVHFHNKDGDLDFEAAALSVHDRIGLGHTIFGDGVRVPERRGRGRRRCPKLTIPSPNMVHYRGGRAAIDESVYPDLEPFWTDLTAAYAEQVRRVAELGCTYLQLDDTSLAYLNDPEQRALVASQGGDPEHLHEQYVRNVNAAIAGRPDGLRVTTHMCRGNFRSSWAAEGGYDFVAEVLFSQLDVDGFFLEYDDERSGGFEPLRFVPEGKQVVLGLVTTKTGELEDKDDLKRRIDEASKFVPLEQLCLSPQCGFSSTVEGNELTVEQERAKLRLVVETAEEVWAGNEAERDGTAGRRRLGGQGLQGRRVDRRGRWHVRRGRARDRGRARHDGPGRRRRRRRGGGARRPRRSGSGRRCRTPLAPAVLRKAGDLWAEHADEIRDWNVREVGAIPPMADFAMHVAAEECYQAASLPGQPIGQVLPSEQPRLSMARQVPAGVVAVISPFNVPIILGIRSVAPALALGNAVILKPDPRTAVTGGTVMARIFEEAGLPAGVLQMLPGGKDVGEAMVTDPHVRVISFTGSTAVGRSIGELAGRHLKRAHLELGGNSALLILDDADVEQAVGLTGWASFLNQGQICMTTGRYFVADGIYDDFVDQLAAKAGHLPVGDPATEQVALGPVIDEGSRDKIHGLVTSSVDQGARLAAGGEYDRLFYRPTVLAEVPLNSPVFTEEVFGPVAPVTRVSSVEDAVRLAAEGDYGLSLGIVTRDVMRGLALAEQIPTGIVHINDQTVNDEANVPFGGLGASGIGRLGGAAANIEAFTETRWITVRGEPATYPF